MGRKKVYPDNASRQRAWQKKQKEKELQQQIETAQKTNSDQANQKKKSFEQLVAKWFNGKTVQQAKEAFQLYKRTYQSIGQDMIL